MNRPASRSKRSQGAARLSAPDLLSRILQREQQLGYADTAVIGGLDRFLEARRRDLQPVVPDALLRTSYATLSPFQRRVWAQNVLAVSHSAAAPITESPRAQLRPAKPAVRPAQARPAPRHAPPSRGLDTPLAGLAFVPKSAVARLEHLGLATLRDLLYFFPSRHIDYSQVTRIRDLREGLDMSVVGTVSMVATKKIGPPPGATQARVGDGTGWIEVTWFRQPYLAKRLRPGSRIALSGRVQRFRDTLQLNNPEYELLDGRSGRPLVHAGNLLPVYPSTEGLQQRTLRTVAKAALDVGVPLVRDALPDRIREAHGFPGVQEALRTLHLPPDLEQHEQARRRIAFDELFVSQIAVQRRRATWRERGRGVAIAGGWEAVRPFVQSLPFTLTNDQQTSLGEILSEMATDMPMGRLLQGEVGSGKTVVALAALLAVVLSGRQGALMAPTEVLTEQHFLNVSSLLNALPLDVETSGALRGAVVPGTGHSVVVALLIGSLRESTKSRVREMLGKGEVDLVIGTHALIEEAVEIPRLSLAVVDEQHRFGVAQRAALHGKGSRPHLLAMSATPIPRSLALTLYGDLDLSTLRVLPSGRRPIQTRWMRGGLDREDAYRLIRDEVAAERQAFVVCPFIDESEQIEARAATVEYERLRGDVFPNLRVGLLHGRMTLAEKQDAMERFRARDIDVLVATPVVEVGIDVPNATVMVVESADRFGLSQLHQLRGRVGRGEHQSYCLLLADDPGQDAQLRLEILERARDGFELSEEDLRLRGPGDYLGTRQSGFPELKAATLSDVDLMDLARDEAVNLLASDPGLNKPENARLAAEVTRLANRSVGGVS